MSGTQKKNMANPSQASTKKSTTPDLGLAPTIFLLTCILLTIFVSRATAMQPTAVTYAYNITPQNDLYELEVHPNDNLLQGRSYDLTKVYGVSGQFAHWNNYWNQGLDCHPDYIVNTSYIKTNGQVNPKNVYMDPAKWPRGDWFQWDGCYDAGPQRGEKTADWQPYLADDSLMFTVINYSVDLPIIQRWENTKAEALGIRGGITIPNGNISPIVTTTELLNNSTIRGK
jgi:hypothetical protein